MLKEFSPFSRRFFRPNLGAGAAFATYMAQERTFENVVQRVAAAELSRLPPDWKNDELFNLNYRMPASPWVGKQARRSFDYGPFRNHRPRSNRDKLPERQRQRIARRITRRHRK